MSARSSRKCTAFTTVSRGVSTTSVKVPIGSKVVATVRFAVTGTRQTPVPLHNPPRDQNAAEPTAGIGGRASPPRARAAGAWGEGGRGGVGVGGAPGGGAGEENAPPAAAAPPPPLHPVKAEPAAGRAVRVTAVPLAKLAEQVAPQSIPVGLLVTVPVPMPVVVTLSTKVGVKVAVTVVAADTVTAHVPMPLHPPLHPVKAEPVAGRAVSVTAVPLAKLAQQVGPPLIPG